MELTEKERKRLAQYRKGLSPKANVIRIAGLVVCFFLYMLFTVLALGAPWWTLTIVLGFSGLLLLLCLPDYRMRLLVARLIDHALKGEE